MANLTGKELGALSDQLGLEKMMCCKYQAAAQECTDQSLTACFQKHAEEHKQYFECLLGYLK